MSHSLHHIDIEVTKIDSGKKWHVIGINRYKGPNKLLTCELIQGLHRKCQNPWLCFGDFNLIISIGPKFG